MILDLYEAASPDTKEIGRRWYPNAWDLCELIGGDEVPVETVARVVAILSPRTTWNWNVRWATQIVHAFRMGWAVPAVSTVANRMKAWRELHGEPALSGQKSTAFARAILGDDEAVVIDSWVLRTVGLSHKAKVTPHRQRWITAAYAEAAKKTGETPRDLQAIAWCQIRGGSR